MNHDTMQNYDNALCAIKKQCYSKHHNFASDNGGTNDKEIELEAGDDNIKDNDLEVSQA